MKLHCILRRFFIPYNLPELFQGCEKLEKSPLPLRIGLITGTFFQHDISFTIFFWRQRKVNHIKQKQRSLGGAGTLCFFSGTAGARTGGGGGRKPRS
jgi:hypothetical protein